MEAILPINESGPYFLKIFMTTTKEELPEMGRMSAKGRNSLGRENFDKRGVKK